MSSYLKKVRFSRRFKIGICAAALTIGMGSLPKTERVASSVPYGQEQIAILGTPATEAAANLALDQLSTDNPEIRHKFKILHISVTRSGELEAFLRSAQGIAAIVIPDSSSDPIFQPLLPQLADFEHPPIFSTRIDAKLSIGAEPESVKKCTFQVAFSSPKQGRVLADFSRQHLGAKIAGILVDMQTPTAVATAYQFQGEFERSGGSVWVESYGEPNKPLPSLEFLKAGNLDVLLLPDPSDALLSAVKRTAPDLTLVGSNFWEDRVQRRKMTGLNDSFYAAGAYADSPDNSGDAEFRDLYRETFLKTPLSTDAGTYDAIHLITTLLEDEKIKQLHGKERCNALNDSPAIRGTTGMVRLNDTGSPLTHIQILQIKSNKIQFKVSTPVDRFLEPSSLGNYWRIEDPGNPLASES